MEFWWGLLVGSGIVAVVMLVMRWRRIRHQLLAEEAERRRVDPQVISVLALIKAGAMVVGRHDEVLHSNTAARTLGLVRGDRIALPVVLDMVRSCRRDDSGATSDIEVKRGAGAATLHLTVRVAPMRDGMMVVMAEDRTPLLRVDETRRDFVANVSHELKTPIGAISLLSEAVGEAADDLDAVLHFSTRLRRESDRLSDLVGQIIELSRLQSGDPMPHRETAEVVEIVERSIDRCRELARERQVSIATAGDENLTVPCDPVRLEEAITNLLQNAIVYSDCESRVAISFGTVQDADDDFVEISVADNGIGIKPEEQQRIFERFYRVDYARSRESGGTGLGLSIVKHIAAVHGGTVSVWSRPSQGSTFTLRLPARDPQFES